MKLMVQNPHIAELGFSGEYVQYASEVHGKAYFTENAATHVHAATKVAYGSPR